MLSELLIGYTGKHLSQIPSALKFVHFHITLQNILKHIKWNKMTFYRSFRHFNQFWILFNKNFLTFTIWIFSWSLQELVPENSDYLGKIIRFFNTVYIIIMFYCTCIVKQLVCLLCRISGKVDYQYSQRKPVKI